MPGCSAFNYTGIIPPAPKTASTDLTALPHQPVPGGLGAERPGLSPAGTAAAELTR